MIDKYIKIKVPRAALTKLVDELTALFDERIEYHDSLIENEFRDETQETLIDSAVKDLSEILHRLAVEIRARPSVARKLRYSSEDIDSDHFRVFILHKILIQITRV